MRTGWLAIILGVIGLLLVLTQTSVIAPAATWWGWVAEVVIIKGIGFGLLLVAGYLLMRSSARK